MSGTFNGYHVWLGIPLNEQPPNHYRLLGITVFETDLDVIDHAADRQMAHVRTFQSGKNGGLSQQILNELASARLCLLNPEKKVVYDRQLKSKFATVSSAVAAVVSPTLPSGVPVAKAVPVAQPVTIPRAKAVGVPAAGAMTNDSNRDAALDMENLGSAMPSFEPAFNPRPRRRSARTPLWQGPAALGFIAAVIVICFMLLNHYWADLTASGWKDNLFSSPAAAPAEAAPHGNDATAPPSPQQATPPPSPAAQP